MVTNTGTACLAPPSSLFQHCAGTPHVGTRDGWSKNIEKQKQEDSLFLGLALLGREWISKNYPLPLPYLQKIELLTMAQFQTHLPKSNLYQPSVTWAETHQKLVRPRECVAVHLPLFEQPDHGSVVRCSLQRIGRKNPHVPHTSCKIPMFTWLNLYPHVLSHNLPCLLLNFLKLFG